MPTSDFSNKDKIEAIASHVGQILKLLELNEHDPSLERTPERVAKFLLEFRQPFSAIEVLGDRFESESTKSIVAQQNIPFRMMCEHHLAPAFGRANVGYLPSKGKVIGLSKITRLVQAVGTEKPSLQETVCDKIADLMSAHVDAQGVMVVIWAEHTCMTCRGVNSPGVITITSAVRGIFRDVPEIRQELLALWGMR